MEALVFDSVSLKGTNDYNALNNISFCLEEGECLTIIGPSGSGKKGVFSLIAGIAEPDFGTCKVFGNSCYEDSVAVHRMCGYADSESQMYSEYTLEENIELYSSLYSINKEAVSSRFSLLVRKIGLWNQRNEQYSKLKISERIKASLIRAVIHSPKLLVVYDIFEDLDRESIREIKEFFDYLREEEHVAILLLTTITDCFLNDSKIFVIEGGTKLISGYEKEIISASGLRNKAIIRTLNNRLAISDVEVIPEKGRFIAYIDEPEEICEIIRKAVLLDNNIIEARVEEVKLEEAYLKIIEDNRGEE
ncbi:MAG: ABC transporter ATP-binding protein [Clostridia bacterium]|nr:ABC transporter ATP-binding protein [Clostridia bacterium]